MKHGILLVLLLVFLDMDAQITYPRISPMAVVEQTVGLTKVRVIYSRPGVRGRKIMGDLVPYGRIWRVGANESTKFTVDSPIEIKGMPLSPGTYALYAFPEQDSWEIVFHTNTEHWGDGRTAYDPSEDVFRIEIIPEKTESFKENFQISFDRLDHNKMDMLWEWEHTRITIPMQVDTDALMRKEIDKQIALNPTAQTYYESARYLQEQGVEAETALAYLNKAIELNGDTYYYHRVKSMVEASLGQYENAIRSATISRDLAQGLGKDEFVRMNQKNIEIWQELLKSQEK